MKINNIIDTYCRIRDNPNTSICKNITKMTATIIKGAKGMVDLRLNL